MLVMKSAAYRLRLVVDANRVESHARYGLKNCRVMRRFPRVAAPAKWTVIGNQYCRDGSVVDFLERSHDSMTGIQFVVSGDFWIRHGVGDGYRPMKIISVRRPETRNGATCLSPGRGILRVRMSDSADRWERLVQSQMSGEIGRGAQLSFDNLSGKVGDNQVSGRHGIVGDPARFDDDQTLFAGDPAHISESEENQSLPNQLKVGLQHLFAQVRQQHRGRAPTTGLEGLGNRLPRPVKVEQWVVFVNLGAISIWRSLLVCVCQLQRTATSPGKYSAHSLLAISDAARLSEGNVYHARIP